jgi:Alpha-glutamyl/putrescinyl thymine pyrophosphorylase clade 3
MPTFCRHNRFIERCPICSKSLPGQPAAGRSARASTSSARGSSARRATRPRRPGGESLRVHREGRAEEDGYHSPLLPGLRASADAARLAGEIAFSNGRLLTLETSPSGLYAEARTLAEHDLEQATWICFLIAYLSPLEGEEPFAGISEALDGGFSYEAFIAADSREPDGLEQAALDGVELGPHSSHDRARGVDTLVAYRSWVERGGQAAAFTGDPGWSPERRFERLFERLALPGLGRMGRYELLVTLGRLGLYELRADSLHLSGVRGLSGGDPTTLAAKRIFAIGDPIHLERRAAALAEAISVPVETLDLALANWASPERATLGFPGDSGDPAALERARDALGL